MATLALTATRELLGRLPSQDPVAESLSIMSSTARDNDDGTWSVVVYAPEDRIPELEALGYDVRVLTTDAQLRAHWQEVFDEGPPIT